MTIDEAINFEKQLAERDKKGLEKLQKEFPTVQKIMDNNIHEQIVEWLKELKVLREKDERLEKSIKMFYGISSRIRIKTIDEFAEILKESLLHNYRNFIKTDSKGFEWLTTDTIDIHIYSVAEQLKVGMKYENI